MAYLKTVKECWVNCLTDNLTEPKDGLINGADVPIDQQFKKRALLSMIDYCEIWIHFIINKRGPEDPIFQNQDSLSYVSCDQASLKNWGWWFFG